MGVFYFMLHAKLGRGEALEEAAGGQTVELSCL